MLADKIISERKRCGLNQEELADKLGVSRQAVSKWESAQAMPDIARIVQMAELFGCTTDYLLTEAVCENKTACFGEGAFGEAKRASGDNGMRGEVVNELDDKCVHEYVNLNKKVSVFFAIAVALCVLSPALLILLAGFAEYSSLNVSKKAACAIGLTVMFLLIAAAVFVFVTYGIKISKYEFMKKQRFKISEHSKAEIEQQSAFFEKKFVLSLAVGVTICILAALPLIISGVIGAKEYVYTSMTALLLAAVSVGVAVILKAAIIKNCYDALLERGDYSKTAKKANKVLDAVNGAFWCFVTAGYLAWSFISKNWGLTWIVWPIAAVSYGAIVAVVKIFIKTDNEK